MAGTRITFKDVVQVFHQHPHAAAALACIDAFTSTQSDILARTAEWQAQTLRGCSENTEAVDLLAYAIERALNQWSKHDWIPGDPRFFKYLWGALRSTASNIRRHGMAASIDGNAIPVDIQADLEASLILEKARTWLENGHATALAIFDGMRVGFNHEEIRKQLRVTPQVYAAAYMDMRRTVRREAFRVGQPRRQPRICVRILK